jgi:hypothetical protein
MMIFVHATPAALADELERVDQCGQYYDRRAVLIVVKNRYIEFFLESLLDLETTWRGDVFKIDSAEYSRDCFNSAHDLVRIFRVETDRKGIDAGEFFEQHCLAFHHRQCGCWSNVAETENCCSVCHHCDCVLFDRERENFVGVFVNRVADPGNAGSVSHREIGTGL